MEPAPSPAQLQQQHQYQQTQQHQQQLPVYHFKILVPSAAAGRIIGKGGTTIAQLQRDAGARVKMSKASEFYPGTTERVCLISGPIEGILKINDFFMENFSSTSIKILVPNSTAGMIIGRSGSYIKRIKEESGAYVQISQKCTDLSLPERCVTIVGELENIRKACAMILAKIVEDAGNCYRDIRPTSSSSTPTITSTPTTTTTAANSSPNQGSTSLLCPSNNASSSFNATTNNLSLTKPTTPDNLANSSPSLSPNCGGSINGQTHSFIGNKLSSSASMSILCSSSSSPTPPPLQSLPQNSSLLSSCSLSSRSNPNVSQSSSSSISCGAGLSSTSSSSTSSNGTGGATSDINSAQIIESIKLVLRVSGYGEDAVSEITSAMSTLASYGVLGVGLGLL